MIDKIKLGSLFFISLACSSFVIFTILTYGFYFDEITSPSKLVNFKREGMLIKDHAGNPFFSFFNSNHIDYVSASNLPQYLKQAIVASEDKNFYNHQGFSTKGILRAFVVNFREGKIAHGGSTITQQLVKNTLLTPQTSYRRKLQEILLAVEIERLHSKEKILEMYINTVYFGKGAYGVEQASKKYFGKGAKDLTLAESAFLVGLLPAPSKYSPYEGSKELALERKDLVLSEMLEEKFITGHQLDQAKTEELVFADITDMNKKAPHFAILIRDILINRFGLDKTAFSGISVKTSIDLDMQQAAEKTIGNHIGRLEAGGAGNLAVVAIEPETGYVKSLVGSKNWYDPQNGKINMAVSPRQPGSAFKPLIYAAAFEKGIITPASMLEDRPKVYDGTYRPKNYDSRFRGMVTVRRSLANSLNVPTIEVMSRLGVRDALQKTQEFGINSIKNDPSLYGYSFALGAAEVSLLELTNAYASFADEGLYKTPVVILEIKDKYGKVIYEHDVKKREAVTEEVAFLISSILSDNQARREVFGGMLDTNFETAVKTGTTDNFVDGWTIGYTPNLAVGVWVGNNDRKPMSELSGALGPAPVWRDLMHNLYSLKNIPLATFKPPEGIVEAQCRITVSELRKTKGESKEGGDKSSENKEDSKKTSKVELTTKIYMVREYFLPEGPVATNCS